LDEGNLEQQRMNTPEIHSMRIRRTERIVLAIGLALVGIWAVARFQRTAASRSAIARLQAEETITPAENLSPWFDPSVGAKMDFRLWSSNRITAYGASLTQKNDKAIALLRIPKINIEAPIFDDTGDVTLNRGGGRIQGTARIGQPGNVGVAGHRVGFFRGLKDIGSGDILELQLPRRTEHYVVKEIQIVKPEDTSILSVTATPTLTLVERAGTVCGDGSDSEF
jgi:sortase A